MEENKDKRVLRVELGDDVKKVSITGKNGDEKVVMRQELSEDDLEQATGGYSGNGFNYGCVTINVPDDDRFMVCRKLKK